MICGLRWVAPSQQGQYHSKLLDGLLQAEERDREPQLIRQEELIFNKRERWNQDPKQFSGQLFPPSAGSTPRPGSSSECWKTARAYWCRTRFM